jgi:uncharacterized OB-fold protein
VKPKSNRYIIAHRCRNGCLWLHAHEDCPHCGGRLTPTRIPNDAVVVSNTVVRVNPTGSPVQLGVARTSTGATTLCIIHGAIRGNGRDRVRLFMSGGRFHALARGFRNDSWNQSQSEPIRQSRRL